MILDPVAQEFGHLGTYLAYSHLL